MTKSLPVTVAIPTYRRERVLLDTVAALLELQRGAAEILLLDQTVQHENETERQLREWHQGGQVRWLRLPAPSIPKAMNRGLLEAAEDIVLFLDDDIIPFPELVSAHVDAHRGASMLAAGRVLQPWDTDVGSSFWIDRRFASMESRDIEEFMGGNFSLRRKDAIDLGGFDENFVRVAYNFEREFADRWRYAGHPIHFFPRAAIRHLKAVAGGTRTFGEHMTTLFPDHSVGAYYYLLRSRLGRRRAWEFVARPFRSVMTRHHLRRPWWIPVTLVAELAGMFWALGLNMRGPRYCDAPYGERG